MDEASPSPNFLNAVISLFPTYTEQEIRPSHIIVVLVSFKYRDVRNYMNSPSLEGKNQGYKCLIT